MSNTVYVNDENTLYRGSNNSAGFDLKNKDQTYLLKSGERFAFNVGRIFMSKGNYYGSIRDRSGLAFKNGIKVLGGVIDNDYRDDIKVILLNTGPTDVLIENGMRIAQIIFTPYIVPDIVVCDLSELYESEKIKQDSNLNVDRNGGFGSSGLF